jgi:hypothetical protein
MATYPYTSNTARLKEFLEKSRKLGVPDKFSQKIIESMGFKSKNDRSFLAIFKFLGLIDSDGTPNAIWQSFRNDTTSSAILAKCIRQAYKDLFSLYPDAYRKDNEALTAFFSSHTKVGAGALKYMVITFKGLCDLANFENGQEIEIESMKEDKTESPVRTSQASKTSLAVNINVQLVIPATDDPKTYDLFFAAMKKYLIES